ncbi:hypothetical protein [Ottowia testudinis]|uniref:Uncharacterized protein n=1 Tax=Ottowia testudinis TaxID=2816950 RepID=A0A975CK54_9BURK|nr:hypothetical protein [Ottowia testudinis]QTD46556.1 hypothetical protein J1M35_06680 [Ottowia testudinis]
MDISIYQPFIKEGQKKYISSEAIPWDARENTGSNQREYELFKRLQEVLQNDPPPAWGLVSWKFELKSNVTVGDFRRFASDKLDAGADCVFINPMMANEALFANVWEQGILTGHPGMDVIVRHLSKTTSNIYDSMGKSSFAFCNYFVGSADFWFRYFEFLDRRLDDLERESIKRSSVGQIYAGSAQYGKDHTVTMKPFVVERLFSTFLISEPKLKVAYWEQKSDEYRNKFGQRLGNVLYRLSQEKNEGFATKNKSLQMTWNNRRKQLLSSSVRMLALHADDVPEALLLDD